MFASENNSWHRNCTRVFASPSVFNILSKTTVWFSFLIIGLFVSITTSNNHSGMEASPSSIHFVTMASAQTIKRKKTENKRRIFRSQRPSKFRKIKKPKSRKFRVQLSCSSIRKRGLAVPSRCKTVRRYNTNRVKSKQSTSNKLRPQVIRKSARKTSHSIGNNAPPHNFDTRQNQTYTATGHQKIPTTR